MKLTPFGLLVRTLRLEAGLTLKNMADALGVTSAYLSSIELGDRPLTEKIAGQAIEFFKERISTEKLDQLQAAVDKTTQSVPTAGLDSDDKVLVAAFARRLTEGAGVPDEVMNWLRKGDRSGRS
ncbi:helix-turn-helix domain-containing protein [Bordetella bronchialis]|uniref:HTH cro/C1-type domain-containing protein n=1 Tax=Bordetella bronchialis TaxID=463025 RepID=A0A193FW38_9BORD|nr:helix-turn-helix transcriptional regulator [Bordetella bronchialis]ANN71568.1 hypothetical protein BAU08_09655 [Bordetella bronchialis]